MTERKQKEPVSIVQFIGRLVGHPDFILALGAVLLGLLSDLIASLLGEWQLWGLSGNVVISVALIVVVLILFLIYRRGRVAIISEGPPEGKAGVILLLSILNARARGPKAEAQAREAEVNTATKRIYNAARADTVAADDFQALRGTNLEPALHALEYHYEEGTLKDCWCIGTPGEASSDRWPPPGSVWLARVLEHWFTHLHPEHKVTFQPAQAIGMQEYAKLAETIDGIYRKSIFKERSIICDITGGSKLMTMGVGLACVRGSRDMQYMFSARDAQGEPVHGEEMVPVLIDIKHFSMKDSSE